MNNYPTLELNENDFQFIKFDKMTSIDHIKDLSKTNDNNKNQAIRILYYTPRGHVGIVAPFMLLDYISTDRISVSKYAIIHTKILSYNDGLTMRTKKIGNSIRLKKGL